ncbi:MAG: primosomal protein N', partial [Nitrospinota bacterium]
PQARVGRLDRDAARPARGGPGEVLGRLRRGEVDILVGTQMVAKGHHFPRVTLAGVIAADLSLNIPDFRAAERTFQLLTQVAGRSGRGEGPGEVIVQAFHCDHYAIQCAREHDYASFFAKELEIRRALGYPPFRRLARLTFESRDEGRAKGAAERAAREVRGGGFAGVEALGPAEALVKRVKEVFRYQVLLKGERPSALREAVRAAAEAATGRKDGVRFAVDVDPAGPF